MVTTEGGERGGDERMGRGEGGGTEVGWEGGGEEVGGRGEPEEDRGCRRRRSLECLVLDRKEKSCWLRWRMKAKMVCIKVGGQEEERERYASVREWSNWGRRERIERRVARMRAQEERVRIGSMWGEERGVAWNFKRKPLGMTLCRRHRPRKERWLWWRVFLNSRRVRCMEGSEQLVGKCARKRVSWRCSCLV